MVDAILHRDESFQSTPQPRRWGDATDCSEYIGRCQFQSTPQPRRWGDFQGLKMTAMGARVSIHSPAKKVGRRARLLGELRSG